MIFFIYEVEKLVILYKHRIYKPFIVNIYMATSLSPEKYKVYKGRYIDQMPQLLKEGRNPLTIANIMAERLNRGEEYPDWNNFYFSSSDAIAYHPDGSVKIILNADILLDERKYSNICVGEMALTDKEYDELKGFKMKVKDIGIINHSLSQESINDNILWNVVARDNSLLNEYSAYVFSKAKEKFKYYEAMGIYFPARINMDGASLVHLCLGNFEKHSAVSYLNGDSSLDYNGLRLIGAFDKKSYKTND